MKGRGAKVLPMLPADAPRGMVVTVIGPPDSGKSRHLWHCYTRHAPRVLTLEVVEETLTYDPTGRRTYGIEETIDALSACAALPKFHVIASLGRPEIERLFAILCPELRSARTRSYARAVGGLVVACGELVQPAPLSLGQQSFVRDAFVRFRHHWLSIYGATQHAPLCHPVTRLAADRCVFFNTPDDLAREAIKRASSRAIAARVDALPQYHTVTVVKSLGRAYVADAEYRVYEVLDYRGALVERREIAGALAGVAPSAGDGGALPALAGGSR